MTPAEAEAIGRRLKAEMDHRGRPGMLAHHDLTGREHRLVESTVMSEGWWFDLRDPATRGAALDVVRERWGDAETYAKIEDSLWTKKRDGDGRKWRVITSDGRCIAVGDTEAEALVAALEAAPKVTP